MVLDMLSNLFTYLILKNWNGVAQLMFSTWGTENASFIAGKSVHNQL